MGKYRPDRVVRILTGLISLAYYFAWLVTVVTLIALPAALLPGLEGVTVGVPVTVPDLEESVAFDWDTPATAYRLGDARAQLEMPLGAAPLSYVALLWLGAAAMLPLTLRFLYHLRRIFQRVRDGAPFDLENARRLRSMGFLQLAISLGYGVFFYAQSLALMGAVTESSLDLDAWIPIDGIGVFTALVLIALAEIFRRGSSLEEEQSLVV